MDPGEGRSRGGPVHLTPAGSGWLPRLHLIATDREMRTGGFERLTGELMSTGGSRVAVHLRGGDLISARDLFHIAERLARVGAAAGTPLLINDRIDVALAVGAAGVQLGERSMPAGVAREVAPRLRLGASVHSAEGARAAAAGGADFLVAGTLWASNSHPGRPGSGIGWLAQLPDLRIPIIGIGGVTPARARALRSIGVHGAAVVSGVWRAGSPVTALIEFLNALHD